jgi:hypothetical protein
MTENLPISFGDNVRVLETPATQAVGVAGLAGQVYGWTTPSVTGVNVIGELKEDYAINVYFEERGEELWFASDQLELLDHAPGTEITLEGVDKKWLRNEAGEWEENPGGTKYKSVWEMITGRIFKRNA